VKTNRAWPTPPAMALSSRRFWRLKSSTIRLQSYGYDNAGYVQVRYAERKPDNTL
jgi:hypothetical protein